MDANAEIRFDSSGMYGFANSGSYEAGAYFAMPTGSYKVLFSGRNLSGITVAQGSEAPTSSTQLSEIIQRGADGSYYVTGAYLEIRWMTDAPIEMTVTPIFESFCYAHFTPTPTLTPSPAPTRANIAPQVNAGADQSVVLPSISTQLHGIVSDDGLPSNMLTISWSQASGPGTASFSDPNSTDTTVVFSESGTYVLRLTASDGEFSTSDDVTIDIHAPSDLVVQSVETSSIVFDGQTLRATGTVSAEIKNNGSGSADGAFVIAFFEDLNGNKTYEAGEDNLLGSAVQNSLAPSATATVSASIAGTLLFRGNLVYAFVDAGNSVLESNENNNINYSAGTCEYVPSTAPFSPTLEWEWKGGTTLPTYNQVMMAPVIADINEDGIPDIIFASFAGSSYQSNGHLRAISGQGGTELFTVTNSSYDIWDVGSIAIGDIDLDGRYEIVAVDESGNRLIAFEHDGVFKWRSPTISGGINRGGAAIADLDGDGTPEVIVGSTVLNNNGTLRWAGTYGKGNNADGPLSLVADLDLDGVPEIVAGNTAYRADGSLYWNNASLTDGFNAVANFDSGPYPEIVLVDSGKVYLLENNGSVKWGPVSLPGGGSGGAPTIADMDNDGELEIGVAGSVRYAVFETNGTVKWSSATQDGSSNVTGSTVFDFEADGSAEVIYRDELKLRIYRGSDGAILWETPSSSGTTYELPVVADVDADGNAEIIMVSNNYRFNLTTGIQVFGDAADQWVATRQTWNQHTYHITNVNDDGSIPAHEVNNWDVYNNYRLNTLTAGCVYAKPDLTASYVRRTINETGIVLTARIGNGGGILAGANAPVAFYDGDPASGGVLLGTAHTSILLQPGQFEDVTLSLPSGTLASPIWVAADDDGTGHGLHTELNEDNNQHNSHVYLTLTPNQAPVVDAGSDQELAFSGAGLSTSLSGTVSDDGLPINLLTQSWTMASGPGNATFADASAPQTTVTFDQPGVYILRLTASDDELSAYDEVTVTVTAPITPTPTASPTPIPTIPPLSSLTIPGWIASPENESSVSEIVPIVLTSDVTLTDGTIQYWPANDRTSVTTLADNLSGTGGSVLASLDTTLLANGSYVVMLSGTDSNGVQMNSGVMITVTGEFKPGRVRFTITDLTIPVTGLPIVIGRTYDSLERDIVGDFGNGWTLAIANPRLEADPAHNVTLTMPDGRRTTFHFTPQSYGGIFGFFLEPLYTPEAGVYGSLEVPDCLLVVSGGKYYCFLDMGEYQPAVYTYTDPYGRQFLMSSDGTLRSITDLNGNVLTFSPDGITSSMGDLNVPFVRDSLGRITQITDPEGGVYGYVYDADGNLSEVHLPGVASPLVYHYDASHFFLDAVDPRGNTLIIDTYYPDGRLESETDALGNTWNYAYDVNAHTTTITNPDNGAVVSVSDDFGKLLSQTDPLGHATTFTYDSSHNLLTRSDALHHTTTYTYDNNGNQTSVANALNQISYTTYNQYGGPTTKTDAMGNVRTVHYDDLFMPTGISDTLGTLAGFTWDAHGSLLTISDGNGKVTTNTYDLYGNLTSETDPLTRTTSYTYDMLGRKMSVTDAHTNTTSFEYDPLGRLITSTEPLGKITHYEYDANGNKILMVDPRGKHTGYIYDAANRLTAIHYPDGSSQSYTYDWRGNVLTETDQAGHTTLNQYDLAGQLTSMTYTDGTADAGTIQYGYDAAGRKVSQTDPLGHITTYIYDAADRLLSVAAPLNNVTTCGYDANGRCASITDANSHQSLFAYDVRGRLTQITFADSTTLQQSYDGAGNPLSRTDQDNKTTSYIYAAAGQLLLVTDPLDHSTAYTYDLVGNLLTITDANSHQTAFAYDSLNRQIQKTWPDASFETFGYDLNDNQISHRLADGHTNTYAYDDLNRLAEIYYFDGQTVDFTYNLNGLRETAADARGVTRYAYDNQNRPIRITQPDGQAIAYTYDKADNRLSLTTLAGTTNYAYDDANQLISVTNPQTGTATYTYDALGLRTQLDLPNGIAVDYGYDTLNRLTDITQQKGGATIASYAYTLDAAGNRLGVTEADGASTHWAYDDAYRLTNERRYDGNNTVLYNAHFTYDPVGNRLTQTVDGATTNYTYNELDQLLTAGPVQYQYDGRGNLTQATDGLNDMHYAYDAANRLTGVALPDGTSVVYTYDADGRRIQQNIDSQITSYLWDETSPYGDVILETDGSGAALASYVLGGAELLSQTRDGTTSYYLPDGQGNIRVLTDDSGYITDTYAYSAFGEVLSRTGSTVNPYQYTSQQFDALTSLYSLRARYYDPAIGRFLTQDPFSYNYNNPVELNRYVYTANNPINYSDPSGLQALAEYIEANRDKPEDADIVVYNRHHLLPEQFEPQFRKWFDIDDFRVYLDREIHLDIHGRGGGAAWKYGWNNMWKYFFKAYPNATDAQILQYLVFLLYSFNLI